MEEVRYSKDGKTLIKCPEDFKGTFVVPDGVTSIGENAFKECKNLTSIEISDSVTSIKSGAFTNCVSLSSIKIPNSITKIGVYAFDNCSNLTSIKIPNSVTYIGEAAFCGCSKLKSYKIPDSITKICMLTFNGCSKLASITIPKGITEISEMTFFGCKSLKSIKVDDANEYYVSVDNVLFTYKKDKLIQYPVADKRPEYAIPSKIKSIGYGAFQSAAIISIHIPNSIKEINEYAFYMREITELHIHHKHPEKINVGNKVFNKKAFQATLYVPNGTEDAYRNHPIFGKFENIMGEK